MPGWLKLARNIIGAAVLLLLLTTIGLWFLSYPSRPGQFYRAGISETARAGHLLKAGPYLRDLPEGASARRILHTTTLNGGVPATASALVLWKDDPAASETAPRRVIAWARSASGAAPGCGGSMQGAPYAGIPALDALLNEGWVLVASDYAGLTTPAAHPYLIGNGEARSVLDAVRAAHDLPDITLSLETIIWGHSQGGHAALWSGILARNYAPELQLKGIAAIAPATDLPAMVADIETTPEGRIFSSYVARAYADTYPDLYFSGIVRPEARWQATEISKRCLGGIDGLVPALIADKLTKGSIFRGGETGTSFRKHLAENVPDKRIAFPILILQGKRDEVVSARVQAGFARRRCQAGETIDYQAFDQQDHMSIIGPDSPAVPELLTWTRARFAGRPAPAICPK
ncbi:lipase family protein [Hyphomonas sp. WL0036]|uniref:lipase family protein n=1 Tax=Hyphomonas sediminis TaxID=2866160 RepID=UPI001C81B4B2|nr:lipase family protein [Hyphomonas sediminis]MBY9065439.1 lipase family protein [Hyphomonas sediminis]